jgi:membrane protein YdbS with pleckstrin-like domain
MSTPAPAAPAPPPKYIKAVYLGPGEAMLRETRATLLYYLPAPVFWLIVFGILDYAALPSSWAPGIPYLSPAFHKVPAIPGHASSYLLALLGLITLLLVLWLLVRLLLWMKTAYAVTTSRVIVQRGILSRDFDEIPVNKVRAVDVHQSAIQRLLGYGTVRVTSEGENPIANEAWLGIPKPWEFQKLVDAAAQRYYPH